MLDFCSCPDASAQLRMRDCLLQAVCKGPNSFRVGTVFLHCGVPVWRALLRLLVVLCRLLQSLHTYSAPQEPEMTGGGNCQVSSHLPENWYGQCLETGAPKRGTLRPRRP